MQAWHVVCTRATLGYSGCADNLVAGKSPVSARGAGTLKGIIDDSLARAGLAVR